MLYSETLVIPETRLIYNLQHLITIALTIITLHPAAACTAQSFHSLRYVSSRALRAFHHSFAYTTSRYIIRSMCVAQIAATASALCILMRCLLLRVHNGDGCWLIDSQPSVCLSS